MDDRYILIAAQAADWHGKVVYAALAELGIEAKCLFMTDYPSAQSQTLRIKSDQTDFEANNLYLDLINRPPAAVWLRRPETPFIKPLNPDPVDYKFLVSTNKVYASGLWQLFRDCMGEATWMNDLRAVARASSKASQLLGARKVGFQVPDTLITNDPIALQRFFEFHGEKIICKSFLPYQTVESKMIHTALATPVGIELLSEEESIAVQPAIYQPLVSKDFEVRVFAVGDRFYTARIESQRHEGTTIDWRARELTDDDISFMETPREVMDGCRRMLKHFNLLTASFDFIVTPDGDWIFLEFNESGQFLFLELADPKITTLDGLIRELVGPSFGHVLPELPIRLEEVLTSRHIDDAAALFDENHVDRQRYEE